MNTTVHDLILIPKKDVSAVVVRLSPDYSPRNLIVRKAKWKWERKGTVVP